MEWIVARLVSDIPGGLLLDEMGLGKTVQAAVAVESACRTLGCL